MLQLPQDLQDVVDANVTFGSDYDANNPLFTSQDIRDRASIFRATLYRAASPSIAQAAIAAHARGHPTASHHPAAWRCMVLRPNHTGLSGPDDFELRTGSQDDGEKGGGAAVLRAMTSEGVVDAVVVVSRWYGGVMLGPLRFAHIDMCAREVGRMFCKAEEVEECVGELEALEGVLAALRAELREVSGEGDDKDEKQRKQDYAALRTESDLPKARRLVKARERAVHSVRKLLEARKKENE